MFRYINMPKLVAHYLREFSFRDDGEPSIIYKFVFCLCLPFVSNTFYKARLIALAIAECTNSEEQILRLLAKLSGATITPESTTDYMMTYDSSGDATQTDFAFDSSNDTPLVSFYNSANFVQLNVNLNGFDQTEFDAYLSLLIPFYINYQINYI